MALLEQIRTAENWKTVFASKGIPDEVATQYAEIFYTNQLTEADIADIDKQMLITLQITVLGHQLKILRLKQPTAIGNPQNTLPRSSTTAAKSPSITFEMTHPQFRKFCVDWDVYKTITTIPTTELPAHLYNACDPDVQNSIINAIQNFLQLNEQAALDAIESVVTRRSNPAIHRMSFSTINQGEHEPIKDFLIRLRSAAVECEFDCPNCKHDLSPINIRDQFIRGLNNSTLQTDILAKASLLKDLNLIISHAEAFETAIYDQSQIDRFDNNKQDPPAVYGARSSNYKRLQNRSHSANPNTKQDIQHSKPCSGCGSTNHGAMNRSTKCPAWGQECRNCGIRNHFAKVCRQTKQSLPVNSVNLIAHVKYDPTTDTFASAANTPLDEVPATIIPLIPDHSNIQTTNKLNVFPDSGASICIAGVIHLEQLNVSIQKLTPCTERIEAVGGFAIPCKGWLPVEINIEGHTSQQRLYICNNVDRIYLSKQGCMDVCILPKTFPRPMTIAATTTKPSKPLRPLPPPRPAVLPYPPTVENVPRLEAYIKDQFADSAFNRSPPFPAMSTTPVHIHLKPNSIPHARHSPIPVPIHWKDAIKASLDKDVERGIISTVPVGTPVDWCSPMVIVTKKDGTPRRTVDLQRLNQQCQRETHHCQSPFQLASKIPPNSKKTVIDAVDGYHAIPLDNESQPLTTFITEWGRYMYLRMPQGFVAAGDAYTRRFDDLIADIPRKVKIVDDTLLYDTNIEDSFYHTWDFLTLCALKGIVANDKKFQFCRDSVEFAGLNVTSNGVAPSNTILSSISGFPTPSTISDARSWFGLVNQVSWAYSISPIMQPFRNLLKPNTKFYWDETLQNLFETSKTNIIKSVHKGVAAFDPTLKTCLQSDWSKDGIGYLLLQKHCSCTSHIIPTCCPQGWRLVYAGSRFTTSCESRYAPTEGEALAVVWSLQHSRMFTQGCEDLVLSVDHKPLLGIFNDRDLNSISNPRLQRFKESTLPWQFTITYNPGKWHRGPDSMSRHPVAAISSQFLNIIRTPVSPQIIHQSETLNLHIGSITMGSLIQLSNGAINLDDILLSAQSDSCYLKLLETITNGFPDNRNEVNPLLRDYWNVKDRLSIYQGVALLDKRIIIPQPLKRQILEHLHSAHQGVTSMKARANQCVYWPGMDAAIRNYRNTCTSRTCIQHQCSQQAEPLIITPTPKWPFQQVCMDYFFIDQHAYLVIVDRFSSWICIYHCKPGTTTSAHLINTCRELFIAYGVPEEVSSDGGPQFKSRAFSEFLQQWDIHHRLSSAGYAQSNGRAEAAVKSAKQIIRDSIAPNGSLNTEKAARAILQHRNTPLPDCQLSPAQILFHRQLRDTLPNHPSHFQLHADWLIAAQEREQNQHRQHQVIIQHHDSKARLLPPLDINEQVVVQDLHKKWSKQGKIIEVLENRQYRIRLAGSGRTTLQNRRFIRPCKHIFPHPLIGPSPTIDSNDPITSHTDTIQPPPSIPPPSIPPPSIPLPSIPLENQPEIHEPVANQVLPRVPRALKNLESFNKAGRKDL